MELSSPVLIDPHRIPRTTEFIAKAKEIKGKGVDAIYCIASNDAFVVRCLCGAVRVLGLCDVRGVKSRAASD